MTEFHWTGGKKYRSRKCKTCWKIDDRSRVNRGKKSRSAHLRLNYQITEEDFDALVNRFSGLCWICKQVPDKINVDHDHKTGKVRGILCTRDNKALGLLKDNVDTLKSAIEYLESDLPEIQYIDKYLTKEQVSESKRNAVRKTVRQDPTAYSRRNMRGGKSLTKDTIEEMLERYGTGFYTQKQVAEEFGVCTATVVYHVRKHRENLPSGTEYPMKHKK